MDNPLAGSFGLSITSTSRDPITPIGHQCEPPLPGQLHTLSCGLSVRRLAALAELSPAYLSRLEHGARRLSLTIAEHPEAVLVASEPSSMRKKR